jgi:16S rRNA (guanine527-N7)-methyltransferase
MAVDSDILREGVLQLQAAGKDRDRPFDFPGEEALGLLTQYREEIERFNPAYGLVGAADRRELEIKHILDSLAPLDILRRLLGTGPAERPRTLRIADVGSGAGLPGIPLAIAMPDCSFVLIERMGRRAGFLRNTLAMLGLSNVLIEEQEMEKAAPGRFDLITFRAFRALEPRILRGLFRLLAPGGALAAYKGRRDRIDQEGEALKTLAGTWEVYPCPVPFLEEERHLVAIRP